MWLGIVISEDALSSSVLQYLNCGIIQSAWVVYSKWRFSGLLTILDNKNLSGIPLQWKRFFFFILADYVRNPIMLSSSDFPTILLPNDSSEETLFIWRLSLPIPPPWGDFKQNNMWKENLSIYIIIDSETSELQVGPNDDF